MKFPLIVPKIVLMATAAAFSSCSTMDKPVEVRKATAVTHLYDWYGDGVPGSIKVLISQSNQKAYFSKNGQPVGWTYVATGLPGHRTPNGRFTVTEKIVDKKSNLYGVIVDSSGNVVNSDAKQGRDRIPPGGKFVGARMPYWMRLTSYGVGMHAGPIPSPGNPASHGCIRMPADMARILHDEVVIGTPVIIEQ